MSYLYDSLARYGDIYALKLNLSPKKVINQLKLYESDWVAYNPRKNIPRKGLSITSLDGGLSGIPDLDSIREYNIKHNLDLDETDFNKKTELWPLVQDALTPFENYLGRTHFIRMDRTGCFPPHRDDYSIDVNSFRLFIAIDGCNPPDNYFIIEEKICNFIPGKVYFINTCKEHTVFTTGSQSTFVVANITISDESVNTVLNNLLSS
tara:strand:- start:1033 stop:1653 length:621 start_codon:yes stop_codon:yes gene_type:complete